MQKEKKNGGYLRKQERRVTLVRKKKMVGWRERRVWRVMGMEGGAAYDTNRLTIVCQSTLTLQRRLGKKTGRNISIKKVKWGRGVLRWIHSSRQERERKARGGQVRRIS